MKSPVTKYVIVSLLFLAAVLNYVDKNTFALLAPTIQRDLNLSDQSYANIQNAFQIAYLIASLTAGIIVDRFGARLSMALFVGWWSLANVFTSFAKSATSFGGLRFLLGLGEAGNWMGSPKTVSEWFPVRQRGMAIGIYTAGTPIGMTIAPLIIISLASAFGWRFTLTVTGLIGLVWLIPWFIFYRREKGRLLTEQQSEMTSSSSGWTWCQAFARREVWCLMIARMFSDPIWFFYQNWYPKYLVSARGYTQSQIKNVWVIFLAAGLGCVVGGWLAGRLMTGGLPPEKVRLWVMLGCAFFMPLSPLVALSPSIFVSMSMAALIVFMHLAWLTNLTALAVDIIPAVSLGTVFGIVAGGGSLGGIAMNSSVAWLLKNYSYTNWFWIAGFLHLAVIPLLIWGVNHRKSNDPLLLA